MKLIQRIIYTGFAAVAIASAAMPVFPAHALAPQAPDADRDADVDRTPRLDSAIPAQPAPSRAAFMQRR